MLDKFRGPIERITEEFTKGDFFREVFDAKKEYFEELGVIPEDDPDFENQMDMFMGWYLFDRPLKAHDLPPVTLFYRKNREQLAPEEEPKFRALTEVKHSVFELLKIREGELGLRDLANRQKFDVLDDRLKAGFSKGDIFEARLVPDGKSYVFIDGFCFHPKEAFKFIAEQMKKIREDDHAQRTKLLRQLGQMKTKHQRFPHIDVKHIYTLTPKF